MKIGSVNFDKYVNVDLVGTYNLHISPTTGYVADYSEASYKDEYAACDKFQQEIFSGLGVTTSNPDLNSIGALYITPSARVPRYKLRDLKEKHGVTIVRDPKKATTIVVAKDEINQLRSSRYGVYMYEKTRFVETINRFLSIPGLASKIVSKNHKLNYAWRSISPETIITSWQEFTKVLTEHDTKYVVIPYHTKDRMVNFMECGGALSNDTDWLDNRNTGYIDLYEGEDITKMLIYANKKVYTDAAFQSILGSGAIDCNQYEFIDQLLSNSDDSNIEMGLTLMANCNFEQSAPYLMLLLTDHHFRHRHISYTKSVAFKSLMSFIGMRHYNTRFDDNDVMNMAKELGLITDELKEVIKKRFMNQYSHLFKPDQWVYIKDIVVMEPESKEEESYTEDTVVADDL